MTQALWGSKKKNNGSGKKKSKKSKEKKGTSVGMDLKLKKGGDRERTKGTCSKLKGKKGKESLLLQQKLKTAPKKKSSRRTGVNIRAPRLSKGGRWHKK